MQQEPQSEQQQQQRGQQHTQQKRPAAASPARALPRSRSSLTYSSRGRRPNSSTKYLRAPRTGSDGGCQTESRCRMSAIGPSRWRLGSECVEHAMVQLAARNTRHGKQGTFESDCDHKTNETKNTKGLALGPRGRGRAGIGTNKTSWRTHRGWNPLVTEEAFFLR